MIYFIYTLQVLIAFVFIFSGFNKAYFSIETLVKKGQTAVENIPLPLVRFIGYSELLGGIGIILPTLLSYAEFFVPISALCLGTIMIPAAYLHFKRKEYKTILINLTILIICIIIALFYQTIS